MNKPNAWHYLPVAEWPETDRCLWAKGREGSYFKTLNPITVRKIMLGYGRWLSLVRTLGGPGWTLHPAGRVTPASISAYIDKLQERRNTAATIDERIGQLAAVLRIMVPECSFTWLHPKRRQRTAKSTLPKIARDCIDGWPEIDRQLWQSAFAAGDPLMGPCYAKTLSPATIHTVRPAYQRWLNFLRNEDRLALLSCPATRVTRANVIAYVRHMRPRYSNAGLIAQLSALRTALRILQPDVDFHWLTAPGGRSLASLLPIVKKPIRVISSTVLYEWGREVMRDALVNVHPEQRRVAFRDGLLIALFAARAPRVRSMASLCLGTTVIQIGTTYRFVFESKNVKTRRSNEYDAPVSLSAALQHYIAVERAQLLGTQSHNALWLDVYGEPLSISCMGNIIRRRSKQRFGEAFGPHRFRHAIGTTAPLLDPTHPGIAAAVLGISGHMVERHYNRASQADVANRLHATLRQQRARLQSLARREFEGDGYSGVEDDDDRVE